ncbi:MAG TPA: hypothetical protein VGM00_08465 [Bradyrhizobium sp.]|jgi:hypothetical protein
MKPFNTPQIARCVAQNWQQLMRVASFVVIDNHAWLGRDAAPIHG